MGNCRICPRYHPVSYTHLDVYKRQVLLMDESTSALDPISTSKIEDLVSDLKKEYTIIMVTHNMQQAARISDKTAFFLLGDLVEFGETEELFSCLLYTSRCV